MGNSTFNQVLAPGPQLGKLEGKQEHTANAVIYYFFPARCPEFQADYKEN